MYEKEINLIPGNVFYRVPKCSKQITVRDGGRGSPRLNGPGFLDYWAVGPWVKNCKMITDLIFDNSGSNLVARLLAPYLIQNLWICHVEDVSPFQTPSVRKLCSSLSQYFFFLNCFLI